MKNEAKIKTKTMAKTKNKTKTKTKTTRQEQDHKTKTKIKTKTTRPRLGHKREGIARQRNAREWKGRVKAPQRKVCDARQVQMHIAFLYERSAKPYCFPYCTYISSDISTIFIQMVLLTRP